MDIVFNITTILGSESSQGDFPFPIRTLEEAIENQMVELHPELAGVRVVISSAKLDPTFDTSLHIASDDFVPDFDDTGDDDETDGEYDRPDAVGKTVRVTGCTIEKCNGKTGTVVEVLDGNFGHRYPWYKVKLDDESFCTTESFEEIIPDEPEPTVGMRVRVTGCISGVDNNRTGTVTKDHFSDGYNWVDLDGGGNCLTRSVEAA